MSVIEYASAVRLLGAHRFPKSRNEHISPLLCFNQTDWTEEMSKLLIVGLIVLGALHFFGSPGGVMRHSGGNAFSASGGAGIKGYANSSRGAVKGIGSAAGGVLK